MSNTKTIIARILLVLSPVIVIVLGYYSLFYLYLDMKIEDTLESIEAKKDIREKNLVERDSVKFDTIRNK